MTQQGDYIARLCRTNDLSYNFHVTQKSSFLLTSAMFRPKDLLQVEGLLSQVINIERII